MNAPKYFLLIMSRGRTAERYTAMVPDAWIKSLLRNRRTDPPCDTLRQAWRKPLRLCPRRSTRSLGNAQISLVRAC
jgi:hypothetical protein